MKHLEDRCWVGFFDKRLLDWSSAYQGKPVDTLKRGVVAQCLSFNVVDVNIGEYSGHSKSVTDREMRHR